MWFLFIFILIPLVEVAVFAAAGDEIGILNTLVLCLVTAMFGGFLVKKQGMETLMKGQLNLNKGVLPVQEMFDGICLIAAGAMLITPGFVTDSIGFLLLIPAVRVFVKQLLIRTGKFSMHSSAPFGGQNAQATQQSDSNTIEGTYEKINK